MMTVRRTHRVLRGRSRIVVDISRCLSGGGCPYGGEGGVCLGDVFPGDVCRGVYTTPPVNRITDRCKNISVRQTSFVGGSNGLYCAKWLHSDSLFG